MKTIIKNGKKSRVTEALYNILKKKKVLNEYTTLGAATYANSFRVSLSVLIKNIESGTGEYYKYWNVFFDDAFKSNKIFKTYTMKRLYENFRRRIFNLFSNVYYNVNIGQALDQINKVLTQDSDDNKKTLINTVIELSEKNEAYKSCLVDAYTEEDVVKYGNIKLDKLFSIIISDTNIKGYYINTGETKSDETKIQVTNGYNPISNNILFEDEKANISSNPLTTDNTINNDTSDASPINPDQQTNDDADINRKYELFTEQLQLYLNGFWYALFKDSNIINILWNKNKRYKKDTRSIDNFISNIINNEYLKGNVARLIEKVKNKNKDIILKKLKNIDTENISDIELYRDVISEINNSISKYIQNNYQTIVEKTLNKNKYMSQAEAEALVSTLALEKDVKYNEEEDPGKIMSVDHDDDDMFASLLLKYLNEIKNNTVEDYNIKKKIIKKFEEQRRSIFQLPRPASNLNFIEDILKFMIHLHKVYKDYDSNNNNVNTKKPSFLVFFMSNIYNIMYKNGKKNIGKINIPNEEKNKKIKIGVMQFEEAYIDFSAGMVEPINMLDNIFNMEQSKELNLERKLSTMNDTLFSKNKNEDMNMLSECQMYYFSLLMREYIRKEEENYFKYSEKKYKKEYLKYLRSPDGSLENTYEHKQYLKYSNNTYITSNSIDKIADIYTTCLTKLSDNIKELKTVEQTIRENLDDFGLFQQECLMTNNYRIMFNDTDLDDYIVKSDNDYKNYFSCFYLSKLYKMVLKKEKKLKNKQEEKSSKNNKDSKLLTRLNALDSVDDNLRTQLYGSDEESKQNNSNEQLEKNLDTETCIKQIFDKVKQNLRGNKNIDANNGIFITEELIGKATTLHIAPITDISNAIVTSIQLNKTLLKKYNIDKKTFNKGSKDTRVTNTYFILSDNNSKSNIKFLILVRPLFGIWRNVFKSIKNMNILRAIGEIFTKTSRRTPKG